jgi:hypothetical protein
LIWFVIFLIQVGGRVRFDKTNSTNYRLMAPFTEVSVMRMVRTVLATSATLLFASSAIAATSSREYTCSPLQGGTGYQVTCRVNTNGKVDLNSCSCAGGFVMIDFEKPVGTTNPRSASPS